MGISLQIKRYVPRIVILLLVVSVVLNVYDRFVILPQMESTVNNMRVEAFNAWRGRMVVVKNLLEDAETNFDVEDTRLFTYWAGQLADIFRSGLDISAPQNELYRWVSRATHALDDALHAVFIGNQTGAVTEQDLDQNVLAMIEDVTATMENLVEDPMYACTPSGVDPAQQFREAGVLSDTLNCLEQIHEVSGDMYRYYRYGL